MAPVAPRGSTGAPPFGLLDVPGIPAGRILCLGDSVEHDILGGQRAGHATALVMSGLHHGAGADALARLFDAAGAAPDHIIDRFDITGA